MCLGIVYKTYGNEPKWTHFMHSTARKQKAQSDSHSQNIAGYIDGEQQRWNENVFFNFDIFN